MSLAALQRSIQQGFEVHAPACILPLSSPFGMAVSAALTAHQMYRGSFVGTLLTGALLLSSGSLFQTEQVSPENVRQKLNELFVGIGESLKRNNFQEALFVERFNKVQKVLAPMQASFTDAEVRSQNQKMTEIATLITSPVSRAIWHIDGLDLQMKEARANGTFEARKADFTARYNAVMVLYNQHPGELAGKKEVLKVIYQMIAPNALAAVSSAPTSVPNPTQIKYGYPPSRHRSSSIAASAPAAVVNPDAIPALVSVVRDARRNLSIPGDLQMQRYEDIMVALKGAGQVSFRQANFPQILSQICNKINVSGVAIEEGNADSFAEVNASGQKLIAIVPAERSDTWLYHLSNERNRLFRVPEWTIVANGVVQKIAAIKHTFLADFARDPENTGKFYGVYTNHPATFPKSVCCSGSIPNRLEDANGGFFVYPALVSAIHVLAKILPANLG